jgi:hypothetical protein
MKLTIGLATRNRPSMLLETVKETLQNIRNDNTTLVVLADTDDFHTVESIEAWRFDDPRVVLDIRERPDSVAEKWNRMVDIAPADVYLPAADDAPHKTPGFDQKILDAVRLLPDGIGVIYNHMNNLSFPSMQAFPRRWMELTDWQIYVTHFPFWFSDHWVDDVARMVGRIVAVDVIVEDRRPDTQEHRDPVMWATLYDALYKEREAMAERIFAAPGFIGDEWQKQMLRSTWHLIHERARMLNNIVRGMPSMDAKPPTQWYEAIRARGERQLIDAYWKMQQAENDRTIEREAA